MTVPIDKPAFFDARVVERLKKDVREWRETKSRGELSHFLETQLKHRREHTVEALHHSDPKMRRAAAVLIVDFWFADNEIFAAPCYESAFRDLVPSVRGAAFEAVCLCARKGYYSDEYGSLSQLEQVVWEQDPIQSVNSLITLGREIDSLEANITELESEVNEALESEWRNLARDAFDEMVRSRERTLAHLKHRNPVLRYVALSLVWNKWHPSRDDEALLLEILEHDSFDPPRRAALWCLVDLYSGSDNPHFGRTLGRIVLDDCADDELRAIAYFGLYVIRDMPCQSYQESGACIFKARRDIDWEFVRSFLRD